MTRLEKIIKEYSDEKGISIREVWMKHELIEIAERYAQELTKAKLTEVREAIRVEKFPHPAHEGEILYNSFAKITVALIEKTIKEL